MCCAYGGFNRERTEQSEGIVMRTLVLGIGNLLLSDEGIGVRIVEALEERFYLPENVDVIDGGTSGMEILQDIASRDLLIVVDAVKSNHEPGSLFVLHDDDVPALFTQKISPHQLGLSDVLMALKMTDEFPHKLILVGIEPASLVPSMSLSAIGQHAKERALAQVVSLLREYGLSVIPKEGTL